MIPLALYFDASAKYGSTIQGAFIALAFPASAIFAQVLFNSQLPRIRQFFILFINGKKRGASPSYFGYQNRVNKKNIKLKFSFKLLIILMFVAAYSAIPLSIVIAAKHLEFRATVFQMVTIFSGIYALINTVIVDPIFSKRYLSPMYPYIYSQLMTLRNFSIYVIQPLIIVVGALYV